jgi:hypothetical protein
MVDTTMAPQQYPKMATTTDGNRILPLRWPDSHVKGGTLIIFNSKAEEDGYNAGSVVGIAVVDAEHPKKDRTSGREHN